MGVKIVNMKKRVTRKNLNYTKSVSVLISRQPGDMVVYGCLICFFSLIFFSLAHLNLHIPLSLLLQYYYTFFTVSFELLRYVFFFLNITCGSWFFCCWLKSRDIVPKSKTAPAKTKICFCMLYAFACILPLNSTKTERKKIRWIVCMWLFVLWFLFFSIRIIWIDGQLL